jgi:hypothetical protein
MTSRTNTGRIGWDPADTDWLFFGHGNRGFKAALSDFVAVGGAIPLMPAQAYVGVVLSSEGRGVALLHLLLTVGIIPHCSLMTSQVRVGQDLMNHEPCRHLAEWAEGTECGGRDTGRTTNLQSLRWWRAMQIEVYPCTCWCVDRVDHLVC